MCQYWIAYSCRLIIVFVRPQSLVHPVSKTHWATRRRQPSLLTASCCATSQVMPMLFKSCCMVSIQFFCGLPGFFLYGLYTTNTGEEGLRETKNNAFGLATEDRGRQYQLRRTKDVRPGQVQMESMKMETCHMAEHYREIYQCTACLGSLLSSIRITRPSHLSLHSLSLSVRGRVISQVNQVLTHSVFPGLL